MATSFISIFNFLFFSRDIAFNYVRFIEPLIFFLALFVYLNFLHIILPQISRARVIKLQIMDKREDLFQSESDNGTDVKVQPIDPNSVPYSLKFSDIEIDTNDWKNEAVADHFHLKSVGLEE